MHSSEGGEGKPFPTPINGRFLRLLISDYEIRQNSLTLKISPLLSESLAQDRDQEGKPNQSLWLCSPLGIDRNG